jgi:ATP-dependent DNA ligase
LPCDQSWRQRSRAPIGAVRGSACFGSAQRAPTEDRGGLLERRLACGLRVGGREQDQLLESLAGEVAVANRLTLSPCTRDYERARRWLDALRPGTDGVVAKRLDAPYAPGERAMVKVKPVRTADCVVGGFRYASGNPFVASMLLGLYDGEGRLNHVGYTATIRDAERAELTRKLEALREPPGFTGSAPGGPSRWSSERSGEWEPLRPVLVAEVRFDHVSGGRFRHGTRFMRWRPDKSPRQCTLDQIERSARTAFG